DFLPIPIFSSCRTSLKARCAMPDTQSSTTSSLITGSASGSGNGHREGRGGSSPTTSTLPRHPGIRSSQPGRNGTRTEGQDGHDHARHQPIRPAPPVATRDADPQALRPDGRSRSEVARSPGPKKAATRVVPPGARRPGGRVAEGLMTTRIVAIRTDERRLTPMTAYDHAEHIRAIAGDG